MNTYYYNDYEINIKAEVDSTYLLNIFLKILIIQYTEPFFVFMFLLIFKIHTNNITINSKLQ